jgi:hypothetical protein
MDTKIARCGRAIKDKYRGWFYSVRIKNAKTIKRIIPQTALAKNDFVVLNTPMPIVNIPEIANICIMVPPSLRVTRYGLIRITWQLRAAFRPWECRDPAES